MIVDWILARMERVSPRVLDVGIALALTAMGLLSLVVEPIGQGGREVSPFSLAILSLMNLPLIARRRHPHAVLSLIGCSTIVYAATGPFSLSGIGVLYAFYSMAVYSTPSDSQHALVWTMLGITVTFGAVLLNQPQLTLISWATQLLTAWLMFGVAWLLGDLMRRRSDALAELKVRAAELEAEREENERLAVEGERARIARELHDVVAHKVSVMVVQAGATRRTMEAGTNDGVLDAPTLTASRDGLAAIEATGRETLAEMRRMVGALRPSGETAYEPTPSLAALDALLERVRSAGLQVDMTVEGERRPLPQGVDLSAYRIVQEALTNTLRHAHATTSSVRLCFGLDSLEVDVTDNGRGAAAALLESPHRGYGLVGMRERVTMIGGELVVGPRPGGGYEVRATLPLGVPA